MLGFIEDAKREREYTLSLMEKMNRFLDDEYRDAMVGKRSSEGYFEFYRKGDFPGSPFYLNHKDEDWIRGKLQYRFAQSAIKQLQANRIALEDLIRNYHGFDAQDIMKNLPKTYRYAQDFCLKRGLIREPKGEAPRFTSSENPMMPEEIKHLSSFGLKTRSKGEALIAEALYYHTDYSFGYEKKLTLWDEFGREYNLYPDFTIFRPKEDPIYWEHKGMMLDPKYAKRDQWKMDLYYQNGIYTPKNLIITCDGPDGSTDMQSTMKLISGYFGSSKLN